MYGYTQTQPQMGYTPNYAANYPKPMLDYQPQQQMMQQQQQMVPQQTMIIRPVASEEEARAVPTDFGGAVTMMPDFAHGRIYTKAINFANGAPVARVYVEQQAQTQEAMYASAQQVEKMQEEIEKLKQQIETMTKGAEENDG